MLSGLETVPLQSRTASRTNMDEHFISAEECVRIFPKKLKESFRVTCGSLHGRISKAPPCSPPHSPHMHEFWCPVRPGSYRGHTETGSDLGLGSLTLKARPLRCPVNTDSRNKPLSGSMATRGSVDLGSRTGSLALAHQTNYACSPPARACTRCWGALPGVYSCPRHRQGVATHRH